MKISLISTIILVPVLSVGSVYAQGSLPGITVVNNSKDSNACLCMVYNNSLGYTILSGKTSYQSFQLMQNRTFNYSFYYVQNTDQKTNCNTDINSHACDWSQATNLGELDFFVGIGDSATAKVTTSSANAPLNINVQPTPDAATSIKVTYSP